MKYTRSQYDVDAFQMTEEGQGYPGGWPYWLKDAKVKDVPTCAGQIYRWHASSPRWCLSDGFRSGPVSTP